MPVVTFKKKYLFRLVGSKITDKLLATQITKLGLNIEEMNDDEISVEVASNRPDLLSAVGFARAKLPLNF